MTTPAELQAIVSAPGDDCVIVPRASTWKAAPTQLGRRLIGRLRAALSVSPPRERVVWDPPSVGSGRIDQVRDRLLRGEIHVHRSTASPLSVVRDLAQMTPIDDVRVGASGGLRQLGVSGSTKVMLRVGNVASPGDPSTHFRALERFSGSLLPAPLGSGTSAGVNWSMESLLRGRQPLRLDRTLLEEVSRFLASLPRPVGDVEAFERASSTLEQLEVRAFDADGLARRLESSLSTLPACVTHGDLWAGNLLVEQGRLSGVIDWDSWSERGVPGTDIIHLFAEQRRRSDRSSYGAIVEARFWENEEVGLAVAQHLTRVGAEMRPALLVELAIAWWMTTIAGAVRRSPELARNREWIVANVVGPSSAFAIGSG